MDPSTAIMTDQIITIDWVRLVSQLGFGGVIFIAFMVLLRWVLKTQEKILENSKEERSISQQVIQGFLKTLEQMNSRFSESHKQINEAHNYQRSEHDKMIDSLNNICSMTKQHGECLNGIKDNLNEQGKILARINGFRDKPAGV